MQNAWSRTAVLYLLSEKRMSTYLNVAHGELDDAFTAYAWNIRLAGALLSATGMVEVVVRNSIDHTLTAWMEQKCLRGDWFDLPMLDTRAKADVSNARNRLRRGGTNVDYDKIIAELTFGFWRFLTTRRYHASLWVPALHKAFALGDPDLRKRQKDVSALLSDMTLIRNRAAHLEPVFRRNVERDIENARLLIGWIDADALAWFNETLRIDEVLADKPDFLRK